MGIILIALGLHAEAAEVAVTNTARYVGNGRYTWKMYLVGSDAALNRIRYVEYTLHPSFPNPIRKVTDRNSKFSLSGNGWGEFSVGVKIISNEGSVTYLNHWLRLQKTPLPKIKAIPQAASQLSTANTSHREGANWWKWRIFVKGEESVLRQIECVEYTLHPTFVNPVRRICTKGNQPGKGFMLEAGGWGTFTVGVMVSFRSGEVRYLKHTLKFGEGSTDGS